MALPNDLCDWGSPADIVARILLFTAVTIIVAQLTETFLERYFRQASIRLKVSATKFLALRRLVVAAIYIIGVMILMYSTPQLRSLSVAFFLQASASSASSSASLREAPFHMSSQVLLLS